MNAPRHTLRVIFALSSAACAVILMLFVRDRTTPATMCWVQVLAAALAILVGRCCIAFRCGGARLGEVPLSGF